MKRRQFLLGATAGTLLGSLGTLAHSTQLPGYTLWDLALAYQLSDNYKLGLTASNLGNKRYVGACYDQNNCWMGAERSVELNLYAGF